jgi:hypothetical protein
VGFSLPGAGATTLRIAILRAIWVPGTVDEAVRDLPRAREVAMIDLKKKRQQLLSSSPSLSPGKPKSTRRLVT